MKSTPAAFRETWSCGADRRQRRPHWMTPPPLRRENSGRQQNRQSRPHGPPCLFSFSSGFASSAPPTMPPRLRCAGLSRRAADRFALGRPQRRPDEDAARQMRRQTAPRRRA
nr:MAG TPA: hypothetical protein [Caudoviricetes sp.]